MAQVGLFNQKGLQSVYPLDYNKACLLQHTLLLEKKAGNTCSFVHAVVPKHYFDIACQDNFVSNADPDLLLFVIQV